MVKREIGQFVKIDDSENVWLTYGKKENGKRLLQLFSVDGVNHRSDLSEWKEVEDNSYTPADFPKNRDSIAPETFWQKETLPQHPIKIVAISEGGDYLKNVFYQYADGSGGHTRYWEWNKNFFPLPQGF